MSAGPGWYPDPGGQPGLFRYWDGRAWSSTTSANPYGPSGYGTPAPPGSGGAPANASGPGANPYGPGGYGTGGSPIGLAPIPPRRRSRVGWIVAGIAVVVLGSLVFGAVLLLRNLDVAPPDQDPKLNPTNSAAIQCPPTPSPSTSASPVPDTGGDRVVSGRLSYPRLPAPFSPPEPDSRTPFGRDVQSQQAEVEQSSDGQTSWVAAVLIARLLAGDGFYGPQQGAAVVAECVIGKFYGDNPVQREDLRNEATTVDGHPAWIIEMHLTFDIPDIRTKGEVATIVVVDTGATDGEAGLFYSSIPDTSPQFTAPAEAALKELQVS